jgi:hypothetical protein
MKQTMMLRMPGWNFSAVVEIGSAKWIGLLGLDTMRNDLTASAKISACLVAGYLTAMPTKSPE